MQVRSATCFLWLLSGVCNSRDRGATQTMAANRPEGPMTPRSSESFAVASSTLIEKLGQLPDAQGRVRQCLVARAQRVEREFEEAQGWLRPRRVTQVGDRPHRLEHDDDVRDLDV